MPAANHTPPNPSSYWSRPSTILLLSIIAGAGMVVANSIPLIRTPFQIDYGEGLMLDGALRIQHGQSLYPNPFGFPVVLHVYGPVAYAAVASILPLNTTSFSFGRWLILGCSLAISVLVGAMVRRMTGSIVVGVSFGLLLLTLPSFRFWFYLLRSDLIGLVFVLIGAALYVGERRPYGSVPFFALALFCKYSLIAAPLAVFVHLMAQRKVRQGIGFVAALAAASGIAFEALQLTTGHWFAFHMFLTHPDPFSFRQYLGLAGLVAASAPVVTALAVWYVVQSIRSGDPSFPAIYLVVSTVTALTAGKLGSTTNHFLEWIVASCFCAGLAYSELILKHPNKALPMTVLLSASVLIGVILQNRPALQPSRELAGCGEAYTYVRKSATNRVLSESLGPVLIANKPIAVSDPFEYGQLVKHGLWLDRQVEDLIRTRYFGLIVLADDPAGMQIHGSEVWPESMIAAMRENYRVAARFNCRYAGVMLEPNP